MVPDNIQIVERYFKAVDSLIEKGVYDTYYEFALINNFDRSQLMKCKQDFKSRRFELAWITPLISEHGLNPIWLFTGRGIQFINTMKYATSKAFKDNRVSV
jgi:hypothetical protein